MLLDTTNWEYFKLIDLFGDISEKGKCNNSSLLKNGDEIAYIGAKKTNNGIMKKVKKIDNLVTKGNCIVFICDGQGSIGYSLYQPEDFIGTINLKIGRIKNLNIYIGLFLVTILDLERFKYSFGRKLNLFNLQQTKIKLPVIKNIETGQIEPDYNFMENYIKSLQSYEKLESTENIKEPINNNKYDLNIENWKYFKLTDLFDIKGSRTTSIIELEEYGKGQYPYITTQAINNGVEGFYNFYTEEGNVLTADSAVLGFCSYQSKNFSASDHVEKLIPKFKINKYIAMFLVTIINLEQYRYNYGRKCSQAKMKQSIIKLPAIGGEPYFEFMENYIKSLPYSKSL
jgi:hypothetical protein